MKYSSLPLCLILLATLACAAPAGANSTMKEAADKAGSAVGSAIETAGDFINDTAITTSVTARFLTTKGLDPMSISVSTTDGTVTLSGEVAHLAQSTLAEEIARQVKGVQNVVNTVTVKKP